MPLMLASPAIPPSGEIPAQYTCDGADISPPLSWSDVPAGTGSLVLVVRRTLRHVPALGGVRHSARLPRSRCGLLGKPAGCGIAPSPQRLWQNRLRRPLPTQRGRHSSLSLPPTGDQPANTRSEGPGSGARRAEGSAALRHPAGRACRHLPPLNRAFEFPQRARPIAVSECLLARRRLGAGGRPRSRGLSRRR